MRAILPKLERMSAAQLIEVLRTNFAIVFDEDTDDEKRLNAILGFIQSSLPDDLKALLVPLAIYQEFIDQDLLQEVSKQVDAHCQLSQVIMLLRTLESAGLLSEYKRSSGIYRIHSALTGFLRSSILPDALRDTKDSWYRAFVIVMASCADYLINKQPDGYRDAFRCHSQNFYYALEQAKLLGMDSELSVRDLYTSMTH